MNSTENPRLASRHAWLNISLSTSHDRMAEWTLWTKWSNSAPMSYLISTIICVYNVSSQWTLE